MSFDSGKDWKDIEIIRLSAEVAAVRDVLNATVDNLTKLAVENAELKGVLGHGRDCKHERVLIWPNPSFLGIAAVEILPLYGCSKCGATFQQTEK